MMFSALAVAAPRHCTSRVGRSSSSSSLLSLSTVTAVRSRILHSTSVSSSVLSSSSSSSSSSQQRYLSSSVNNTSISGAPDHVVSAVQSLQGVHFMSIDQLSKSELQGLLDLSMHYKELYSDKSKVVVLPRPLLGYSMSMIFQKRSTRTRVSTETGMSLLGGHALFLGPTDIQLGVNETLRDTSNVLCRFNDIILARVFGHDDVIELAQYSKVPVINALSDLHHPLQTLADLMTLQEHFGKVLEKKTVAWVGDGNNVLHDLALGSAILGMNMNIATPKGYEMNSTILQKTKELALQHGGTVMTTNIANEAVQDAHCVVTDTWVSMGQEDEYQKRVQEFSGYQVNTTLMQLANPNAVFLHCLPRHQEEVTDDVFYSQQSLVFQEAENRMWTVMAVMAAQLGRI